MQDSESFKKMSSIRESTVMSNKIEPEYFSEASHTELLTNNDLDLVRNGFAPQQYDAFLLYAEEDGHYAEELISNLENSKYQFKVIKLKCMECG